MIDSNLRKTRFYETFESIDFPKKSTFEIFNEKFETSSKKEKLDSSKIRDSFSRFLFKNFKMNLKKMWIWVGMKNVYFRQNINLDRIQGLFSELIHETLKPFLLLNLHPLGQTLNQPSRQKPYQSILSVTDKMSRKCTEMTKNIRKKYQKKNGNSLHDGIKPIQVKSEYRGVAS